jgi:anthranilate phosphoribosyltransferase
MTSFQNYLEKISQGSVLSQKEMEAVMHEIMQGNVNEADMESFLIQLSNRGETVEEITGAANVMRGMAGTIRAPKGALDCCGTGGDASGTYNISTAVALLAAGCGVPVAKHGNRAASSKSGAADVLEALGVNLDVSTRRLEASLEKANFCFLMAPNHHQAMKHVVPVRKKIGTETGKRTIFNLLGPLANPAGTKYQLIGVFDKKWTKPFAQVLKNLGTKSAWIVHGQDGLDEISVCAPTNVAILHNGDIVETTISPENFGLPMHDPAKLKGGNAAENAEALKELLKGERGAYRDIVLANTSAVLNIAGKVKGLKEGVRMAEENIFNGNAYNVLEFYIKYTNRKPSKKSA